MSANFEIIMVLGGGVGPQGELPSWVQIRLKRATELFTQKESAAVLLSGRAHIPDPPITEASAMAQSLIAAGIPAQSILKEEKSTTTLENAYFTRQMLDDTQCSSLTVITNAFHMRRTQGIFSWIFPAPYCLSYEEVSNNGIDGEDLGKRKQLEQALDQFYRSVLYPAAAPGNLLEIHEVLFNKEHPAAIEHQEFLTQLGLEMTLY